MAPESSLLPLVSLLRQINIVHIPTTTICPVSWRSISYDPPMYAMVFEVVFFPPVLPPKPVCTSLLCMWYMLRLSHSSWFDHPNNIWHHELKKKYVSSNRMKENKHSIIACRVVWCDCLDRTAVILCYYMILKILAENLPCENQKEKSLKDYVK